MHPFTRALPTLLAAVLAASCGSGGDDSANSAAAPAPAPALPPPETVPLPVPVVIPQGAITVSTTPSFVQVQAGAATPAMALGAGVNGMLDGKVSWSIHDDTSAYNDSGADITSNGSGGVLSSTSSLTPMYTPPSAPGIYHLQVFNNEGWTGATTNVLVSAITVSPRHVQVNAGGGQATTLTATLSGGGNAKWIIQGAQGDDLTAGGTGGTLSATTGTSVVYTPPTRPGTYYVVASSGTSTDAATPINSGYAIVSAVAQPTTSAPLDILTPMLNWPQDSRQISGDGLLADPVNPGTLYAFYGAPVSNGGLTHVIKSTDFGLNWAQVDESSFVGNAWGVAIDPNPSRAKNTPPTMYSPAGYGNAGVFKSTDGGKTWRNLFTGLWDGVIPKKGGGTLTIPPDGNRGHLDFYQVHVLPDDPPNHILVTYHYGHVLLESTDGGATWELHSIPWGDSHYVYGVDKNTWLILSQAFEADGGLFRTTTAGRDANGQINTTGWTQIKKVNSNAQGSVGGKKDMTLEHAHGAFTPWRDPANGNLYFAGDGGIICSTDGGASWNHLFQSGGMSSVAGTEKYLYATSLGGSRLLRADKTCVPQTAAQAPNPWTDANWYAVNTSSDWTASVPPFGMTSTYNGTRWVLNFITYGTGTWRYQAGQWKNGDVWRYLEP
ncbi:MAG: hypothetical protein ABI605_01265 [Rhizobacter sp.]